MNRYLSRRPHRAGRMGAFHADTLARRLPGTRLAAIADPAPGAAQQLADRLADEPGGGPLTDPGQLLADPAIDAVVIVTPARTHAGLVEAAARGRQGRSTARSRWP